MWHLNNHLPYRTPCHYIPVSSLQGAPNCFADTVWVLTGELTSMTRDVATKIITDHGGKVTSE